jgi:glycerophosphoryl diester phosphodiesterase
MLIYGHRGDAADAPENTLLAFRPALAAGVDGIELDIQATSDGIPVVMHDRIVDRTTDGDGAVDAMPLARLRALDAGRGERVPMLAEVLTLVGDSAHLDLEIKGQGIERATLDVLAAYPGARWAISSFDWQTLRNLRRLDAGASLWPLATRCDDDLLVIAHELGSPVVALHAEAYSPDNAERLRAAGLDTMVWTINDAVTARRVRDLGAYALCTDAPSQIIPALNQH